jgi:hypothetical protein
MRFMPYRTSRLRTLGVLVYLVTIGTLHVYSYAIMRVSIMDTPTVYITMQNITAVISAFVFIYHFIIYF